MASGNEFPLPDDPIGAGIGQKIPMQRSTANQFNNLSPPFANTWTDIVNPDGCESALYFVCMGAGALSSKLSISKLSTTRHSSRMRTARLRRPEQNDRKTPVKALPPRNFVGGR